MAYSKEQRDRIIALRGTMFDVMIARERQQRLGQSMRAANKALVRFLAAWARTNQR